MRAARRALYWLAVLAVSAALVFGFLLLLESQDSSSLSGLQPTPLVTAAL